MIEFLYFIGIGIIAGFLAGQILKGSGFGLLGNLFVGVLGAILGGFVAGFIGLSADNLLGKLAIATGGAILLLLIISFFAGKPKR